MSFVISLGTIQIPLAHTQKKPSTPVHKLQPNLCTVNTEHLYKLKLHLVEFGICFFDIHCCFSIVKQCLIASFSFFLFKNCFCKRFF